MTGIGLLLSVLTKVYNKTEDELKPLILNDKDEVIETAFETIVAMDAAKVSRFKAENKTKFDAGYSKAKEEVLTDAEKKLRDTFGIADELPFDELLPKIKETSTAKSKLTVDDVKKHPEYLALETTRVKKEDHEKVVNEFADYKKNIDRTMKIAKAQDKAMVLLEKFKPDFKPYEDAPQIKSNLLNAYKKSIEEFDDFEITETDIVAIKNGKRVEDDHGNPVSFETICKNNASGLFKFLVQDPKDGVQNRNDDSSTQTKKFSNKEEMTRAYNAIPETDVEGRKKFLKENIV